MSDIVIKAENLGKKYIIGHQAENGRYVALRDVLMQNARSFWRKTKDLARGKPIVMGNHLEEVWALKDVSFEVQRGEVVGIIGRNGAGKSTLLKVLSRITEPSAGRVTIKGRAASLLEVGTGFHPELTGRENIYLNGAILGMTRAEIRRKFDEIVAFAEIEKFLDTPVKRYSSGMYVRLAFAVAAHLEPEILLVDEVLAVGDAAFQKKSLGKMEGMASEGRTVLFVSHNMASISSMCQSAIVLEHGQIIFRGDSDEAVRFYSGYLDEEEEAGGASDGLVSFPADDAKPIQFGRIAMTDVGGQIKTVFEYRESPYVRLVIQLRESNRGYMAVLYIKDVLGNLVFLTGDNDLRESPLASLDSGIYEYRVRLPSCLLKPGRYYLTAKLKQQIITDKKVYDLRDPVMSFEIVDSESKRGSRQGYAKDAVVAPEIPWELEPMPTPLTK